MLNNAVRKFCRKFLAFGISLAAASSTANASTILDLGWPGTDLGYAVGINASGQVAGFGYKDFANPSATTTVAFLYTPGIGPINIGSLGGTSSQATAINDYGQVVGYSSVSGNFGSSNYFAFLYTPGTGMVNLGSLGGASIASGVNNAGQVIGSSNGVFLYTPGIGMTSLGVFGGTSAIATGINASGQVVGESFWDSGPYPFLYTPGSMTDLRSIIGQGAASAINNSGQIVGTWGACDVCGANNKSFLYTPGVGVIDIGSLGGAWILATAVNNSGQIVGYSATAAAPNGPGDAFLYSHGVMTDLNALLPPNSGWILRYAWGINDSGQIVGQGLNPQGQTHAFLLDIGNSGPGSTPSSTVLTSSPNPSFSNELVNLTATVSPSDATGGVVFSDGSIALGTAPVIGGTSSFSVSTLATGAQHITAEYQGDRKYATSMSSLNQEVRNLPSPVLTVGANDLAVPVPSGVTLGAPVVFTEGVPSNLLASPDFTLIPSATTCTGTPMGSCTVAIQFTPQFAGLRRGGVELIDTSGNVLATYLFSGVGSIPAPAFSGSGAAAPTPIYSPAIGYPFGVAVNGAGTAFVTDTYKNQILKISGGSITVVPVGLTLNLPFGLALDGVGNLYIADAGTSRVLKLPYGTSTAAPLSLTGLNKPEGLAVDGAGNLFVSNNQGNNVIEMFAATGGQSIVVSSGLGHPAGLALDAAGDLFIANKDSNQVLKVPVSGSPVPIGTSLSTPAAVAVDGAGDVFIADQNHGRVVEVAGTSAGPGTGAQTTLASGLLMPNAVALDGGGNVFVASIGQGSTSGNVVKLSVVLALQTISFGAIGPQTLGTFPTLTAAASSGLPVSYASKTPPVCTVSGSAVNLLSSGTCTILASQSGSATYLAAPTVAQSFSVVGAGQKLTATFTPSGSVTLGTPVVFTEGVPSTTLTNPDFTLLSSGTTCTGTVTGACTVNIKFAPQYAGLRRGAVKLVDNHNNVVATAYISGVGGDSQTPFTPGAPQTIQAQGSVSGVTVDGAGHVYFLAGSGLIYKMVNGKAIPVPLGTTLSSASAIALDGAGNLYIADSGNNRVLELPYGSSSAQALTITGPLVYPQGVMVDGAGNIFIANTRATVDQGHGTVIALGAGSHAQTTVIANGLNFPVSLATDASGDLFVADWGNNRVLEVAASGAWTSIGAGLAFARGVAVDGVGDVFILDQNHNQVVEVPGTASGPGTGTQITIATGLSQPGGIALNAEGDLFIANLGTSSTLGSLVEIPNQ